MENGRLRWGSKVQVEAGREWGWGHRHPVTGNTSEYRRPELPWLKQRAKFCHMPQVLQSRQATDLGLWLLAEQNAVLSREEKRLLQHIC